MTRSAPSGSLASWFDVWHPAYRSQMIQLAVLSAGTGILVYIENVGLAEFSKSFAAVGTVAPSSGLVRTLETWAGGAGVSLHLLFLVLFIAPRLARIGVDSLIRLRGAILLHRSRCDLEAQILDHLLRKDDSFFVTRAPAEILNRLSGDINRVSERRNTRSQQRQSIFLIIGNLYFFYRADWRLALAALATCAAGAWTMHRLTTPVQEMDKALLACEDHVKASFEDFLRASSEVQVAGLRRAVTKRFEGTQDRRRDVFVRFTKLATRVWIASNLSYVFAFVALCLTLLYRSEGGAAFALVPVVLTALPELFTLASGLVLQGLTLRFADTSQQRLLEYEAGSADGDDTTIAEGPADAAPLVVSNATYRYRTPEGALQGGIIDVTTEFSVGKWTAIVGPAGSGKSTLLQLVVARARTQSGTLSFGGVDYDAMSVRDLANVLTLMPQTLAVLDASLRENLLFVRGNPPRDLDGEDLGIIESTGLGAIARMKALTMLPSDAEGGALASRIVELRAQVRAALASAGVVIERFEAGGRDPDAMVVEQIVRARGDRTRLSERLFDRSMRPTIESLARSRFGRALAERARPILEESRGLLALPSFTEYARLAPRPIAERVWQARVEAVVGLRGQSPVEVQARILIALTAFGDEYGDLPAHDSAANEVRAALGDVLVALDPSLPHPHMTWRENFIFGHARAPNSRAEGRIDEVVLETLAAARLDGDLLHIGLAFQVGRGGVRLSGGQRQLAALTRALLRRTPVIVLDEPTSALDPNSRARVGSILRAWARERVVITVSHDPELVRQADEIRVLEGGHLVASGPFKVLQAESAVFRKVLRVR